MTQDMTQGKIMPMLVHFTIPLVLGSLWLSRCNQEKKGKAQSRRNRRLCQEMFVE